MAGFVNELSIMWSTSRVIGYSESLRLKSLWDEFRCDGLRYGLCINLVAEPHNLWRWS